MSNTTDPRDMENPNDIRGWIEDHLDLENTILDSLRAGEELTGEGLLAEFDELFGPDENGEVVSELLTVEEMQDYIDWRKQELAEETEITVEAVLSALPHIIRLSREYDFEPEQLIQTCEDCGITTLYDAIALEVELDDFATCEYRDDKRNLLAILCPQCWEKREAEDAARKQLAKDIEEESRANDWNTEEDQ